MIIPDTQSRVFYSYTVKMNGQTVGKIQEFASSARKTVERVREISAQQGTRVIEIVPGVVDFSVSVTRIVMYKANLFKALGFEVQSLEEIVQPFVIEEECKFPDGKVETFIYNGCQFESVDYTISTRETLISERATIQVAYVTKRVE